MVTVNVVVPQELLSSVEVLCMGVMWKRGLSFLDAKFFVPAGDYVTQSLYILCMTCSVQKYCVSHLSAVLSNINGECQLSVLCLTCSPHMHHP